MKNKLPKVALLPMAACLATAFAQEAPPAPGPAQDADIAPAAQTVVVTGFRSSLERALNLKQQAVGVRDSIVAEDIGKFPRRTWPSRCNGFPACT